MALIILDPNLEGEAGHHLAYDMAIAREALARGEAVTIIANRRFGARTIEGVRVLPHFTATTYAALHTDPVTGRLDDYRHFNDLLQAELAALPRAEFRPADAVLVPTTTENHLAGHLGWMKGFDPVEAPLFVVHLMFPSGVAVDAEGRSAVEDPLRALFYRLAERAARESGPPVHLFASGGQHAAEFGALFGREVASHPVPICPVPAERCGGDRALLFAGDVRIDKGIALLPGLVPMLAQAHPDWTFVAHVNAQGAWGAAKAAGEALAGLPAGIANLELAGGRLAPADYLALLQGVRIALFPYDPALYRRKSSGVLWEAISLGLPVVVPAGTWLENEARHWGAGHVAYPAHTAEAVAAAFGAALPRIAALEAASRAAAERYRAANGAGALVDQIAALWVRHKAASSLVARARPVTLDLGRMEAGWHRPEAVDGRPVRWTAQEPAIVFDWPFEEGWEAEVALLSFFGVEQLDRLEAFAGDDAVPLSWTRDQRGARLVLRGPGPGRAAPRVALRLRLPYTYRPANEARDLGVLVGGIRVGPRAPEADAAAPGGALPALRVAGAPGAAGGWSLAAAQGGPLEAAPDTPCVLAFRLRAATRAALDGLMLMVNATPVPLVVSPEPEGAWLATATVLPAVLRQAGTIGRWDLSAGDAGQAPVLLAVSAAPMAGGAIVAAEAATAPADAPAPAEPAPPEPLPEGFALRWDLSSGFGPQEGPFPELGVPGGVRWVVARQARLVIEAGAEGSARLAIRYRSLLPRQAVRLALNGAAPVEIAAEGAGLRESGEIAADLALRAGANEVLLGFSGAVREPGTGRELVLLVESVTLG